MPESKKVDEYIENAAPFARPILEHVRSAFHDGCPEIEERIKWGAPSFELNGIVGGMAAFKKHATFGFWRSGELDDPHQILSQQSVASFMAEKFTNVSELPTNEILVDYVRRAAELNKSGKPKPTNPRLNKKKQELPVPDDLATLLGENPGAAQNFESFTTNQRREYIEWITGAKRTETRDRRLATAVAQLLEGKTMNWKYEGKKR